MVFLLGIQFFLLGGEKCRVSAKMLVEKINAFCDIVWRNLVINLLLNDLKGINPMCWHDDSSK